MSLSVVIPSRSAGNLTACVTAVAMRDPDVRVIVVDDGVGYNLAVPIDVVVPGQKPFVFARNCNMGIVAAGDDDVVLLNDDALLETPEGFTMLQSCADGNRDYGVVAAACNNVGNPNQRRKNADGLREDPRMVCFVCVLLPRRTIETVGLLDERFVHYGLDDDDYCLRVRNAGLKIGIFDGCHVDHATLRSAYRGNGGGDFKANLKIFEEKWGHDNFGRRR